MTNVHERKAQRWHPAIALAATCPSVCGRRPSSWPGQRTLTGEGSPS